MDFLALLGHGIHAVNNGRGTAGGLGDILNLGQRTIMHDQARQYLSSLRSKSEFQAVLRGLGPPSDGLFEARLQRYKLTFQTLQSDLEAHGIRIPEWSPENDPMNPEKHLYYEIMEPDGTMSKHHLFQEEGWFTELYLLRQQATRVFIERGGVPDATHEAMEQFIKHLGEIADTGEQWRKAAIGLYKRFEKLQADRNKPVPGESANEKKARLQKEMLDVLKDVEKEVARTQQAAHANQSGSSGGGGYGGGSSGYAYYGGGGGYPSSDDGHTSAGRGGPQGGVRTNFGVGNPGGGPGARGGKGAYN